MEYSFKEKEEYLSDFIKLRTIEDSLLVAIANEKELFSDDIERYTDRLRWAKELFLKVHYLTQNNIDFQVGGEMDVAIHALKDAYDILDDSPYMLEDLKRKMGVAKAYHRIMTNSNAHHKIRNIFNEHLLELSDVCNEAVKLIDSL